MKKQFLTALLLVLPSFAHAAPLVRDLGPHTITTLDVEIVSFTPQSSHAVEVYAKVLNPYTNPISCTMDLTIPTTAEGASFETTLTDIILFPQGVATETESVLVETSQRNEIPRIKNDLNLVLPAAARCRGWRLGQTLPRTTCHYFAPSFEQGCVAARAARMGYISLIREHLHLGDCACGD